MTEEALYKEEIGGHILIIGGAEDKLNEKHILKKFVELAGGSESCVLVVPTSSDFPEITASVYKSIFQQLGVKKVNVVPSLTKLETNSQNYEKLFEGVTGIFLTGGDQMRLSSVLGGTNFSYLMKQTLKQGGVIAGSSAGAASISSAMIVHGEPVVQPQKHSVRIAPGLGILKNVIIDQHFTQRSRLNRLITAVCYNTRNLGIGIDENTAIHLNKRGVLEVLGAGTVTIVDGSKVTYNTIAEVQETEAFSVFGLQVHIISSSIKYDIIRRKPVEIKTGHHQL